ncbi:sjoegren syndrome nuclear autoantigen 1 [Pelomyxa schiedti]|nr:sjoegren syndrome nuclear autoantigen 1 [Pelomyxa schiedti]
MADHGAQLQAYNNELVQYLEDLRERQGVLRGHISKQESERQVLAQQIASLQERLQALDDSLAKKYDAMSEFDRAINQTEEAFAKIVETSAALVQSVKKDAQTLLASKSKRT